MLGKGLRIALGTAVVGLFMGIPASAVITIETVPVGNVGNLADTAAHSGNPASQGAVNYAYNIGKYEVTAGQYTAFLNAVAGVDTYALYNTNMSSTTLGSGIARSGGGTVGNPYTYRVDTNFVNRPVNYVSFWDATRFANWLGNGQGTGSTETGAYTLTPTGISNNTITRNAGATWAVTSEDEWYKAAYHKNDGNTGNYFMYPTSSDTAPGRDLADVSGNNANYYSGAGAYPIDNPYYTTVGGEFQNSASPYNTFDQGGNVFEWNDSIIYVLYRGLRGGSFYPNDIYLLQSGFRAGEDPVSEGYGVGFRVSQVPEPASMTILAFGAVMLVRRRGVRR